MGVGWPSYDQLPAKTSNIGWLLPKVFVRKILQIVDDNLLCTLCHVCICICICLHLYALWSLAWEGKMSHFLLFFPTCSSVRKSYETVMFFSFKEWKKNNLTPASECCSWSCGGPLLMILWGSSAHDPVGFFCSWSCGVPLLTILWDSSAHDPVGFLCSWSCGVPLLMILKGSYRSLKVRGKWSAIFYAFRVCENEWSNWGLWKFEKIWLLSQWNVDDSLTLKFAS